LAPALTDWEALEAPTIYAVFRRRQRNSKLVRAFLDFLVEVFAELESERNNAVAASIPRVPKPAWFGRARSRQSDYVARGKREIKKSVR
jgi:LysR family transcriptional regulator, regulator for bpeEF and oprC